jgi:hypothetical protein
MENDNNEEENPPTNDGPPSRLMITKMVSISLNDIPKSNGSDNARLEYKYMESLTNLAHHRLPYLVSQSLSLSFSTQRNLKTSNLTLELNPSVPSINASHPS